MPTTMPEPQPVLGPPAVAAIFLVVTVNAGSEEVVRDLLPDVAGLTRSVGFRVPEGELSCVLGIGCDLWDRLFGASRPVGLHRSGRTRGRATHRGVHTR